MIKTASVEKRSKWPKLSKWGSIVQIKNGQNCGRIASKYSKLSKHLKPKTSETAKAVQHYQPTKMDNALKMVATVKTIKTVKTSKNCQTCKTPQTASTVKMEQTVKTCITFKMILQETKQRDRGARSAETRTRTKQN